MDKKELGYIHQMIQAIIFNQPINVDEKFKDNTDIKELEELFVYFSGCMHEFNRIVHEFSNGNLDVDFSSKQNMLVGELKQMQSIFKHLTWKTQQIAAGDYNQEVMNLGEFSKAFNTMTQQLKDREEQLKKNAYSIAKYNQLLKSIIDANQDWVIVTDKSCESILYTNKSYIGCNHSAHSLEHCTGEGCDVLKAISQAKLEDEMVQQEFECQKSNRYYSIISCPVEWENQPSYVHYISDCTKSKLEEKQLYDYAYTDALTGVYNRRYCYKVMAEYIEAKEKFSLALFDLNGLKTINDAYGHNQGDIYLSDVVYAVKQYLDGDILCRVGGDEFVWLSLSKDEAQLEDALNRVSRMLKTYFTEKNYSISYGVTYADGISNYTDDQLLKKVDDIMYFYKKKKK